MNPYRRWSVMLLGSRGQIIQFYRFKILIWILALIFWAALAAAGFYYYRYQTQSLVISEITAQVEKLERKLAEYTRKREVLQGRLAWGETVSAGDDAGLGEKASTAGGELPEPEASPAAPPPETAPIEADGALEPQTETENGSSGNGAGKASAESSAGEPAETRQAPLNSPDSDLAVTPQGVAISRLESTPLPDVAQLKMAYRVSNKTRGPGKLKGYTYALLEGQKDGVAHYVIVPDGRATSERPPLQPEGYPFAVRNYLTIRLTAEEIPDFSWIRQVTIFVCDAEGNLIGREQMPLSMN